jgi:iron complex transport system ATP-binding protein
VFEHDAAAIARKALARQVALVPQVPSFPGDITVREYVLLGRTPHLGLLRDGRARRPACRRRCDRASSTSCRSPSAGSTRSPAASASARRWRGALRRTRAALLDELDRRARHGPSQQVLEIVDRLRASHG